AFQDRLANLRFQRQCLVGVRMQGSEESRSPWQIAFSLESSCLEDERVDVVRCDIENLIKLSQRFGETTQGLVGKRVLDEEEGVAWVEPLGFVEVRLAPVPLPSPPLEISHVFRNPAAVGQKRSRLLKVAHRGVVIL